MKRYLKSFDKRKRLSLLNHRIIVSIVIGLCIVIAGGSLILHKATKVDNNVPGWSWVLGGKTVFIDAGHGGVDPGAVGYNNTLEKNINLEVAKRLNLLVTQAGCNVVMLRDDDRDFGNSNNLMQRKREDLAFRIRAAMETEADIYLSIHANSFPDPGQFGPQVFYHPNSSEGEKLALSIQEKLNTLSEKQRAAKANQSYFILKNTGMVAVTVELGFLSNPEEEERLNQADHQQKLAMAIFEGLGNYLTKD
ncbi:MAG: N-acetylmuramoyl-L-alanine amidase [Gracilibacter sp. BRH_c7a]|nr:MAG: N-acetylmuramoyl-L-alanine amidase [Gracilibacter sp. BRH_c7a]